MKTWTLFIKGADLVDGTPVLDIKPYIPYVDAIPNASGGITDTHPIEPTRVIFSKQASIQLAIFLPEYPELAELIEQVLSQHPQPAYKKHQTQV